MVKLLFVVLPQRQIHRILFDRAVAPDCVHLLGCLAMIHAGL